MVDFSNEIGHVNEYPKMHLFGHPRHTQSMIAYIHVILSISGNSREKLHCGTVVNMPDQPFNTFAKMCKSNETEKTAFVHNRSFMENKHIQQK